MGLANDVLALHESILEVIIVEERSGEHVVVDHTTRNNSRPPLSFGSKQDQLVLPELILGVATQFRRGFLPPKIVAASYGDLGVLFCHLTEKQALVIATQREELSKVMELMEEYLQSFTESERTGSDLVHSAIEAEEVARHYLATRASGRGRFSVENVSRNNPDDHWMVTGSLRAGEWRGARKCSGEIDARTGSIMKFATNPSPHLGLRVLALISLGVGFVGLGLLAYLLYGVYVK
ncbi:MAG TPA: hypothetical protein VLV31_13460 [Candidatus Acidoferrales bacterium]|nr:hypothetical protein [Candidatus Acidoferrales bacterium]